MKRINAWLRDYFDMHRSERNGMYILLCFILIALLAQYFLHYFFTPAQQDFTEIEALVQEFRQNQLALGEEAEEPQPGIVDLEKPSGINYQLFNFDPNKLTEEGFQRLGLPPYVAKNIVKYRQKGGQFRNAEDFKRIYGLREEKYFELLPYIDLPKNAWTSGRWPSEDKIITERKYETAERKAVEKRIIELNSADSLALLDVRGIGPAFASRIIKYRNNLGGFLRKEQLLEVYGLDSQKYVQLSEQLNIDPSEVNKIYLNTATYEELSRHPYIRSKHANLIIQYRRKHGNFKSIDELRSIYGIDEKSFVRMREYLRVE